MIKKTFLFLSITFLAVGCAAVPGNAQQPVAGTTNPVTPADVDCDASRLRFRIGASLLRARPSPQPTCILKNGADPSELILLVKVQIQEDDPPTNLTRVEVTLKDVPGQNPGQYTVDGGRDNPQDGDLVIVTIKKSTGPFEAGETIPLDLVAVGIGKLDPRVTVIDTGLREHQELQIRDLVLEELGLELTFSRDGMVTIE